MEIVLKFLYTGRLGITAAVKNIVRELLEDILRIDAKINLPADSNLANDKRNNDGDGGNGSGQNDSEPETKRPRTDQSTSSFAQSSSSEQITNGGCSSGVVSIIKLLLSLKNQGREQESSD